MKHKILITGDNQVIVDEFFDRMEDRFECQCTSAREKDIKSHLKVFQPDFFVYALSNVHEDNVRKMIPIYKKYISQMCISVLIGNSEMCRKFEKIAGEVVDVTLVKPMTAFAIRDKLISLLGEVKEKEQSIKELEEESIVKKDPGAPLKHVLVVDDDPLILRVVKQDLEGEYEVATAINGKLALNFMEKKKTDLVLLDYNMPGGDGPSILQKMRENPGMANIPAVFLTGATEKEKIKRALSLKPQGYMIKPIEREKLISVIKGIIG